MKISRFIGNPILTPNTSQAWQSRAAFNPCPIIAADQKYLLYRAEQENVQIEGRNCTLSTIGIAATSNWIQLSKHRQFISPSTDFDKFGCEDPRATKIDGKYYIFYTAISKFPPGPDSIKIALAISDDLQTVKEKHLITPFNAKAMALFPEKIKGNYAVVLTVDTDLPPSKIAVAYVQNLSDLWDEQFWHHWYRKLDHNTIALLRSPDDQVEVGAAPVLTDKGWLLVHSYIQNYRTNHPSFGIETVLLDTDNPLKIIGRTKEAIFFPETNYEQNGIVPGVIFPSGAIIQNDDLGIFYGGADTTGCIATISLDELQNTLLDHTDIHEEQFRAGETKLIRFRENPILKPVIEHSWENKYTLNPAAIEIDGTFYIVYRAMGTDNISELGLAISLDGQHISERFTEPIYLPRENFEINTQHHFSGCEDPRITRIGNTLYMCYTAYDGVNPTHVAIASIGVDDFVARNWNWSKPIVISPPDRDDKNACLLPEKIAGKYVILHRFSPHIWLDTSDDLNFIDNKPLGGEILMSPRENHWDSEKIGIGPPPIKTDKGWLLIYHGISKYDRQYRLGAVLLDFTGVKRIISRLDYPILEPLEWYENSGLRPGTVFACGAVVQKDQLFIYYGSSDQYVSVATVSLSNLIRELVNNPNSM